MTLVDFYVLKSHGVEHQHHFACRLIEKAVRQGNQVLVATKDPQESAAIDHALWCFRPEAFIPHVVMSTESTGENTENAPVLISHLDHDHAHKDLLVNLRLAIPQRFSQFQRLAEIVTQDPNVLENSRKSYMYFKNRGYPINTHKL